MKRALLLFALVCIFFSPLFSQETELVGANCTSIMVGCKATTDGSVITSHTCDSKYRTWVTMEPAADHKPGTMHKVYKGTMHTETPKSMEGMTLAGEIPEAPHTYAYMNTAYPCLNEKQLAIGESTFSGPDTLVNPNGMFLIEELERIALQRCDNARDAIRTIGAMIAQYGYGDGGECITIADNAPHRQTRPQEQRLLPLLRQYRKSGQEVRPLGWQRRLCVVQGLPLLL